MLRGFAAILKNLITGYYKKDIETPCGVIDVGRNTN